MACQTFREQNKSEAFIIGKQYKEEFEEVAWQEKQSLKLVNSDLCVSPIHTTSLGCSRYLLTFIEDCIQKIWVHFVQNISTNS